MKQIKTKHKRIIAFIVVLAMVITLIAGVAITAFASPLRDRSGLQVGQTSILFDNSNGLPTSEANAIAQTEDGFVWIGSYSGLVRYDGSEFVRFDSTEGIASVVSLFTDSKGRLWVGTNDSGVAVMEGQKEFKFYGKEEGLTSLSIRSITEDGDGNIILGTTEGIFAISEEGELAPYGSKDTEKEYIYDVVSDEDGVIYGLTTDGRVFYIKDGVTSKFYNATADLGYDAYSCIYADPTKKGYICMGTEYGSIVRANIMNDMSDLSVLKIDDIVNLNALKCIDDVFWFCADNGIGFLDNENKVHVIQDIPLTYSVDDVMQDYEGNLWFASSRQGVMEVTETNYTDISRSSSLPQVVVNTTCKYQGLLYVGSDSGLFLIKNNDTLVKNKLTKLLKDKRIRAITEDSAERLWISTYSEYGLICVNKDGSYVSYNSGNGLLSDRIRTVMELSDGTIAGTSSEGIFYIYKDGSIKNISKADGLDNLEILCLCKGDNEELYLGSDGGGLYILNGDKIEKKGNNDGLKSEVILRIKKDTVREGLYWIITSNSIAYMKDGNITTVDKFPYSNNFDIFFGSGDDIWVLSSAGIYRVDANDMLENKKIDYTFYNHENGIPVVTTANSRNYIDESGNLYISGTTGVCMVNIYNKFNSGEQIRLYVPYVTVGDDVYYTKQTKEGEYTVTIPGGAERLTIDCFALTYKLTNPVISYKLDGFDDKETFTTKRDLTPVSYTNLRGGKYEFNFSIADDSSHKEISGIDVKIVKERAFYELPVFYVSILLAIVVIIVICVRIHFIRKMARVEKKQKETQEILDHVIRAFAKCIDLKDRYTNGHSFRVAKYTRLLAEKMGYDKEKVSKMYNIALLHDIGKISIPDAILNKPSGLTDEEYAIMKSHAENGEKILAEIKAAPELSIGAGYHHERLDGKGYPRGVKGEDIPMVAQLIAVADTFDAMYSTRTYSKKKKLSDVVAELRRVGGTQLNKEVVEYLVELAEEGALGADNVK